MRIMLLSSSFVASVALATSAVADIIRVEDSIPLNVASQRYRVTYKDGTHENYIAEYRAYLDRNMTEGGEPSVLFKHPVDTRHCDWHFHSYITRKVYFPNRAGVRFELPGLTKPFQRDASGRGGGFVLLEGHAKTCNDSMSSFNNESNSYEADVNSVLSSTMAKDADDVKRDIGTSMQNVADVNPI